MRFHVAVQCSNQNKHQNYSRSAVAGCISHSFISARTSSHAVPNAWYMWSQTTENNTNSSYSSTRQTTHLHASALDAALANTTQLKAGWRAWRVTWLGGISSPLLFTFAPFSGNKELQYSVLSMSSLYTLTRNYIRNLCRKQIQKLLVRRSLIKSLRFAGFRACAILPSLPGMPVGYLPLMLSNLRALCLS
jgi:hypothetical protein